MKTTSPECKACQALASDYLDGNISDPDLSQFQRHIQTCSSCSDLCQELQQTRKMLAGLREAAAADSAEAWALGWYHEYYPEPERVEGRSGWTRTKELWGRLAGLSRQDRLRTIRKSSASVTEDLFLWLLVRAKRVCTRDPEHALSIASFALEVAREREKSYGDLESLARALSGLAWCYVMLRDYPPAKRLLQEAEPLSGSEGKHRRVRHEYVTAMGFYCGETGRYDEAENLLSEALDLAQRGGKRRDTVCALVNLGAASLNRGDIDKGLERFSRSRELLEPETDPPRLQLTVCSNLVLTLCESGRGAEAAKLLPRVGHLAEALGGWYWPVYAAWLAGTLALAQHRLEEAVEIFEAVRTEFRARQHSVWFLDASLDLARALFRQGNVGELSRLAAELLAAREEIADDRIRGLIVSFAEKVAQQTVTTEFMNSLALSLRVAKSSQAFRV